MPVGEGGWPSPGLLFGSSPLWLYLAVPSAFGEPPWDLPLLSAYEYGWDVRRDEDGDQLPLIIDGALGSVPDPGPGPGPGPDPDPDPDPDPFTPTITLDL